MGVGDVEGEEKREEKEGIEEEEGSWVLSVL